MQLATIKLALPSVDNLGRPYVMLFRQTIDIGSGEKRGLSCKIVNCTTSDEANAIAEQYRGDIAPTSLH